MAGLTQSDQEARLADYRAAEVAILAGQEYEINGRRLRRADLAEIRRTIAELDRDIQRRSRGGIRIRGATPIG